MTLGKIETYLLSQGYQIYRFNGTKWEPILDGVYEYSEDTPGFQFRLRSQRFQTNANGLVYPRPKGVTNEDQMKEFVDSHSAEEIVSIILEQQSKI